MDDSVHLLGGFDIVENRAVPEGQAYAVDKRWLSLIPFGSHAGRHEWIVYLHPKTLRRLKENLWAKQRTVASITYAELMIELGLMREEDAS